MKGEEYVKCRMCGVEIDEEDAIYVEGRPYCDNCYTEAEAIYLEEREDDYDDDDYDDDDIDDLMVKFDRQTLIKHLKEMSVNNNEEVELIVTGKLRDGPPIKGSDTIKVEDKGN